MLRLAFDPDLDPRPAGRGLEFLRPLQLAQPLGDDGRELAELLVVGAVLGKGSGQP